MSGPDGTIRVVSRKRPQPEAHPEMQTIAEWKSDAGPVNSMTSVPVQPAAEGATAPLDYLATTADNGSISHVVMVEGRLIVRRFNDTTHLYDTISAAAGQMT